MDEANGRRPERGFLLIVSGPSGAGKSALVGDLLALGEFPIEFSVSATSRDPRPGETDGVQYHFVSRERFEAMRQAGEFLESAEVHGQLYGTPRGPIETALRAGRWILLEIDVQGHEQVKAAMPEALSFFIRAPSPEVYEQRLRIRGTETDTAIAKRLADAQDQFLHAGEYDFQIVNETLPQALRTFRTLLVGIQSQQERK